MRDAGGFTSADEAAAVRGVRTNVTPSSVARVKSGSDIEAALTFSKRDTTLGTDECSRCLVTMRLTCRVVSGGADRVVG